METESEAIKNWKKGSSRLKSVSVTLKHLPHQHQCRSNVRLCQSNIRLCCQKRQQRRTSLLWNFILLTKSEQIEHVQFVAKRRNFVWHFCQKRQRCQKWQQCWSNVRLCRSNIRLCRKNRSTCGIGQCCFHVVVGVDGASTKLPVASTMLLWQQRRCWCGLSLTINQHRCLHNWYFSTRVHGITSCPCDGWCGGAIHCTVKTQVRAHDNRLIARSVYEEWCKA